MPYWGSLGEGGAAGLPIENLRGKGRAILHGEQEFVYHGGEWPHVGDTLVGDGEISDVYEKEKSGRRQARVLRDRDHVEERAHRQAGRHDEVHARDQLQARRRRAEAALLARRGLLAARARRPRRDPRRHRPLRLGDRHQGLGAARHVLHRTTPKSTTRRTRAARRARTGRCARGSRRCSRRSR